jgi:hypothetical protein
MPDAPTPFAPARAAFPFPGLVATAARAPLGGPRESLTGVVLVARLAQGMRLPHPLLVDTRRARAEAAKGWLSAFSLPAKTKQQLLRAIAASAQGDRSVMADAVGGVTDVTAAYLDKVARSELAQLAESLRRDAAVLAAPTD